MKIFVFLIVAILFAAQGTFSWSQNDMVIDQEEIVFQLYIYDEVSEYLADLFQKFSEGYMDPDTALMKVNLLAHEYKKKVEPVPVIAKKLYELTMRMFSKVEIYFIFYKRANRENPELNLKIVQAKYELAKEVARLQYAYGQ